MSLTWMRSAHPWIHRHHAGSTNSAEATQLLLWPQASYRQWTRPAFPPSGTTRNRNMPETCLPWRWKPVTPSNLQVLTHISRRELQSMIPNKSFIWVLASLKLLGFPSPSVCLRPAGAMLGFAAFLQESQRSSAQQPCTHWNHTDLPSCSQGGSSCTAQPASVGDLLNKNAELNNFLMNGQVLRVLSLPHKLQFTERSSAGTSPALSVPGYPTARGDRRGLLHRATQEIWSRDHVLT